MIDFMYYFVSIHFHVIINNIQGYLFLPLLL